jgi:hypothetical protein
MEKTVYELFDELDPKQKASFIDARLDWASCSALCGEVTLRLCNPTEDNLNCTL